MRARTRTAAARPAATSTRARAARRRRHMTVLQLKEELEARGAPKSGALKSVLRGRLLALIITAAGAAAAERGEESARKRPRCD